MADEDSKPIEDRMADKRREDVRICEPSFTASYKMCRSDLESRLRTTRHALKCSEGEAMVIVYEAILDFLKKHGVPDLDNRVQFRSRNTPEEDKS